MTPITASLPRDLPLGLSDSPSILRRRALVERMRRPASWAALIGLVALWTRLAPMKDGPWTAFALGAGLLAVVAAMVGRLWCALYIANRKNTELCQDGPYSLVRNPLYVFSLIGAVGVALATLRPLLVPVVIGLFLAYYLAVIRSEEARLAQLFPQTYPAYRRAVPRLWPRFAGFRSRETLTLEPRVMTRAMREVIWFPVAFLAVALISRLG